MTQEHEHKQGGCCGGESQKQALPKKDSEDHCSDEGAKKPKKDETQTTAATHGGCCGGNK